MNNRDNEFKQSSLPRSLIPHLYTRPQQSDTLSTTPTLPPLPFSTRTTEDSTPSVERPELPSMGSSFSLPPVASSFISPQLETRGQLHPAYESARRASLERAADLRPTAPPDPHILRSVGSLSLPSLIPGRHHPSPIYSDPLYHASRPELVSHAPYPPRPTVLQREFWREGEAGPSSLVHPPLHDLERTRRRGSSQPAQITTQFEVSAFRAGTPDSEARVYQRSAHRSLSYSDEADYPGSLYDTWRQPSHKHSTQTPPFDFDRHLPYSETPEQFRSSSASQRPRTWSDAPTGGEYSAPVSSPNSLSEFSSDGRPEDDKEDDIISHKGKRRRRGSNDIEDPTKKSRNPRKTAVACNFCRGRKLRCNGAKPSCSNCTARKFQCEYVPVQRRRGPGKAPKGKKSKKVVSADAGGSNPSTSGPPTDARSGSVQQTLYQSSMTAPVEGSSSHAPRSPPYKRLSWQLRQQPHTTPSPASGSDADKGE